jgi:hypothetical protein
MLVVIIYVHGPTIALMPSVSVFRGLKCALFIRMHSWRCSNVPLHTFMEGISIVLIPLNLCLPIQFKRYVECALEILPLFISLVLSVLCSIIVNGGNFMWFTSSYALITCSPAIVSVLYSPNSICPFTVEKIFYYYIHQIH